MIEPVRRVVVRRDGNGKAAVTADGPSPHAHTLLGMSPDLGLTDLWNTDGGAAPSLGHLAADDPADRKLSVGPTDGGTRFRATPSSCAVVDMRGAMRRTLLRSSRPSA